MVDAGPWGEFWKAIGTGTLNIERLKSFFDRVRALSPLDVARYVETDVAALPPTPETFLVLQSAAFGSTPVWWDGAGWRRGEMSVQRKYKARSYWEPGPDSVETAPRATIFTPEKIVKRVERIVEQGRGLNVVHGEAEDVELFHPGVAYIDPPYAGFSGYGVTMDVDHIVINALVPVYVSEGRKMAGCDEAWKLAGGRKGAALNGKSGSSVAEEWLNFFDRTDCFQCIDPECSEAAVFHHHEGSRTKSTSRS
jgi:hypothetical protein